MQPLENQRHEIFARHIAEGKTADEAYMLAGFMPHRQNAHRLMTNDDVQKRVEELQQNAAKRTEITIEKVLNELAKIGFADLSQFGEWSGNRIILKDSKTLPPELTSVVSEVKNTREGVAIKLHDKLSALEKIGKHLAMFTDRTDHTSSDGSMSPKDTASVDQQLVQALVDKLVD